MNTILCLTAATLAIAGIAQNADVKQIKGTLSDRIVSEGMAQIEMRPAAPGDIPGAGPEDKAFVVTTPQFRPPGSSSGLLVGYVDGSAGKFVFVDRDFDGRLTDSEKHRYADGDVSVELPIRGLSRPLPFRLRLLRQPTGVERPAILFTAAFRVEGHADIGGRNTLVSLPLNVLRTTIDIRQGRLGVDTNGDGKIELSRSGEMQFARGDTVMFRVGEKIVSFESVDLPAGSFVLREHSADEYKVIDIRVGERLPDFSFTDFDGRDRKLSDFRGKYLLIDVWGSWCKPCIADVPGLKAAHDRFKDRGFEILGVDYEHGATVDEVRALLKEKDVTWPNALPTTVRELVHDRWRIMAFPTLFLLNPEGVVIEANSSMLRGKRLSETLERVLHKQ